jgi:hypothetical protein
MKSLEFSFSPIDCISVCLRQVAGGGHINFTGQRAVEKLYTKGYVE